MNASDLSHKFRTQVRLVVRAPVSLAMFQTSLLHAWKLPDLTEGKVTCEAWSEKLAVTPHTGRQAPQANMLLSVRRRDAGSNWLVAGVRLQARSAAYLLQAGRHSLQYLRSPAWLLTEGNLVAC